MYTFNDYIAVVIAKGSAATKTINRACATKQLSELQCTRVKGELRKAFDATRLARSTKQPQEALDHVSTANSILLTIDQLLSVYGADNE